MVASAARAAQELVVPHVRRRVLWSSGPITDVFDQPELALLAEGAGIQGFTSAAYVPIIRGGRALGSLNCYSRDAHQHTDFEVKLLQTVARLVGVAAETAIIAERQRVTAAEVSSLSQELAGRNEQLSDLIQAQVELALALAGPGRCGGGDCPDPQRPARCGGDDLRTRRQSARVYGTC